MPHFLASTVMVDGMVDVFFGDEVGGLDDAVDDVGDGGDGLVTTRCAIGGLVGCVCGVLISELVGCGERWEWWSGYFASSGYVSSRSLTQERWGQT